MFKGSSVKAYVSGAINTSVSASARESNRILRWFALSICLLLPPVVTPAFGQTRPAQCLLEVRGVHYLGGPCSFTPLNRRGSFQIADVRGQNLVTQIKVTEKDQGRAFWNGPLGGNAAASELGDASRSKACWSVSGAEARAESTICAWGTSERVYLGPTPSPKPSSILYFGSRVGMFEDIVARQGIDSQNAQIFTKSSRDGAIIFCREYQLDYTIKCVEEGLRDQRTHVVRGNCQEKTFNDADGSRYVFLGRMAEGKDDFMAEFSIKDLATGELLDGSSASGYGVRLGIYQALCPSTAPKEAS